MGGNISVLVLGLNLLDANPELVFRFLTTTASSAAKTSQGPSAWTSVLFNICGFLSYGFCLSILMQLLLSFN